MNKKIICSDKWDLSYLFLLGIILLDGFYHTTMFLYKNYWWLRIGVTRHTEWDVILMVVVGTFVFAKVMSQDKFSDKELFLACMLILIFGMVYIRTKHYSALVLLAFLIIGARGIDYQIILKEYLLINGSFLTLTMISAKLGIIENLVYNKAGGAMAFGIKYTTDFAAHVLTLLLVYAILRNVRITYLEITAFYMIGILIYYFTKARLNTGCIIIFATCCLGLKVGSKIQDNRDLQRVSNFIFRSMVWVAPMFAIFFTGITYFYDENNPILVRLNIFFSTRLALGKAAWNEYGAGLFGEYIKFTGMEGSTQMKEGYFFLDSSYVLILLCYGIFAFILTLVIYVMISERARRNENYYFLCALAVYALHCMVEHRLMRITYDPFLLSLFAIIPKEGTGKVWKLGKRKGLSGLIS